MKTLILFDFDGTLYPFRPFDSEDLLLILSAVSKEEKLLAQDLRERDEHGQVGSQEMLEAEKQLLIGKTDTLIKDVAEYLSEKAGEKFLLPLRQLKDKDTEFYVISCGIAEIAREYLHIQKVDDLFFGVYGKHVLSDKGLITKIDYSEVATREDKKQKAIQLIKEHPGYQTIAIGDGFTDLPIFSICDKAIFIDHGDSPFVQTESILKTGYPVTKTFEELVKTVQTFKKS